MKKFYAILTIIFLLLVGSFYQTWRLTNQVNEFKSASVMLMAEGAGANFYPARGHAGGTAGKLDNIQNPSDKDVGFVVTEDDATYGKAFFPYVFNSGGIAEQALPTVIDPDTGTGDWELADIWGVNIYATTAFLPDAAGGANLGSATNEFANLYLGDSAVIYGQLASTATLTSSASLWTANNFAVTTGLTIPVTTSGDQTLTVGKLGLKTDEDLLVIHGGAAGEVQTEAGISLIDHIVIIFDPAWAYDQEDTYRVLPIAKIGDDFPHGLTIVEWRASFVSATRTTALDMDLVCDTTPDFNPAAGATVMDAMDIANSAQSSTADTGFDSATCANASEMYFRFGADPTDANELLIVDIWYYTEED